MNRKTLLIFAATVLLLAAAIVTFSSLKSDNNKFVSYRVDLNKTDLKLYWKNENGQPFKSLHNLKTWLESKGQKLVFAMNGGMFKTDNSPQGLFVQNNKVLTPLDTTAGTGNFYMKPNGIFYITTSNAAIICKTENFINNGNIKYATQSGPMLIIDGQIHAAFKQGSKNLNIRNGVGILPDNKVIFAMSKTEINFYDFANYFKKLGCMNALYLDGFVSRTYLPEKNWIQTDGNFGVIIGISLSAE